MSKLDEQTYGPGESLITKELIERQINGVMTADEAVEKRKLFMLDYYDMFLPYVHLVREQEDTIDALRLPHVRSSSWSRRARSAPSPSS